MSDQEMFTTPEGFELHKRLMMPEARSFDEVLTYVREWDHRTMTHTSGVVPEPGLVPDPVIIDGNEVGPFCTVNMRDGKHRSIAVIPTEATVEALTGQFVTDDDRLSFELMLHPERDRVLVICQHNRIIGSRYVAYIDPTTIPTKEA